MIVAVILLSGGFVSGYIAGWVVGRYGYTPPPAKPEDYIAVELIRTNRLEIK